MSYVRCAIQGTLFGSEVWSVNPVFDPTAEFGTGVDQGALDAAAAAIVQLDPGQMLRVLLSTAGTLATVKLEVRDDVSDLLLAQSIQARNPATVGTSPVVQTAQAAIVCSIRTNTPGASGRGRLYWPAVGATVGPTGRMDVPTATQVVTTFETYLHAIEGALATAFPTIGFDLAVRSKATKSTPHATRIQVGNVIDTQRRRRDAFPEAYSSVNF